MTPHITRIHHRLDHWRRLFLAVVACASVGQLCTSLMSQSVTFSEYPLPKAMVAANTYGKLPLSFEPNQGQTDARVKVLARTFGYTLFVTADDAVFAGRDGPVERMKLMGANPKLRFESLDRQPGAWRCARCIRGSIWCSTATSASSNTTGWSRRAPIPNTVSSRRVAYVWRNLWSVACGTLAASAISSSLRRRCVMRRPFVFGNTHSDVRGSSASLYASSSGMGIGRSSYSPFIYSR